MPYLYTGKMGAADSTSSSRPGFIKLGSRYSTYGIRMNAILKGPIVTSYTMNANLYPNKTTLTRTVDAVLIPASGAYLTTSASVAGVVTVGVYQGSTSPAITSQKLYRYNPTTGTSTLVSTSAKTTFLATDASAPFGVAFYYILYGYSAAGVLVSTTNSSTVTLSGFTEWYLTRATGDSISLSVTDSSATIIRQAEEFSPISLAYKTVQQGTVIGRRGSIEVSITATDRDYTYGQLRSLAGELGQVYLKSPFGDVYAVDIGEMNVEFVGTGNLKVTIPFIENAIA